MHFDAAAEWLVRWLDEPQEDSRALPVTGPVGVGKSRLLEEVRLRRPGTVHVDCRGRGADDVAAALLAAWGHDADFLRRRVNPLDDAIRKQVQQGAHLSVLLSNVQWAGVSATSQEAERIATVLVPRLMMYGRRAIRVVVERDAEQALVRLPLARATELSLTALEGPAPSADRSALPSAEALITEYPQLRLLAVAERRDVPLRVWALMCAAMELPTSEEDLRTIAASLSDVLFTEGGHEEYERVGFHQDGVRHLVRSLQPSTPEEQQQMTDALLDLTVNRYPRERWRDHASVGSYAAFALPLHAASAGHLPSLMDEASFVANADRHTLLTGLAVSYPEGVPHSTRASVVHYLESAGVEPAGHDEWLSWLHWAEMNRGDIEFADLLAEVGGPLAWATTWTRWRPYGAFGPTSSDDARADELLVGTLREEPVVVTQVETDEDELPDECDVDTDADGSYTERPWRLRDGASLGDPVVVAECYDLQGEVESVEGRTIDEVASPLGLDETPAPRTPASVGPLIAAGSGMWLFGGAAGVFVVQVADSRRVVTGPEWRKTPLLGKHNRSALWRVPKEAVRPDAPTPAWLDDVFGDELRSVLTAQRLPAGLWDEAARAFLTGTGMPALDDLLPFADIDDPDDTGLPEADWPADVPRPEGTGTFHRLGRWVRQDLLLDGATGRIFHDSDDEESPGHLLIAGSLGQFWTLLSLYWSLRRSTLTTSAEQRDARRSLTSWAARIDPATAGHPHWLAIFNGDWDQRDMF
ncbi:SUKH-4 family immunity protein [Streptomyces sp. NPDC007100]|uniref:SUKH-4 family immunity protein n=1 Tax=Streptomyces sp. NPDC007100 TaxID=3155602 RepID=UPI0033EA17D6